ncbi:hypothetical protein D3C76_1204330 [compost metagenome]
MSAAEAGLLQNEWSQYGRQVRLPLAEVDARPEDSGVADSLERIVLILSELNQFPVFFRGDRTEDVFLVADLRDVNLPVLITETDEHLFKLTGRIHSITYNLCGGVGLRNPDS